MSNERKLLPKESTIYLLADNYIETDRRIDKFVIESMEGDGSSAVCYSARLVMPDGQRKKGKLKEFYPAANGDAAWLLCDLERKTDGDEKKDNQLLLLDGLTNDNFKKLRENYLAAYKTIQKAKNANPDLYGFISNFDIYRSYTDTEFYTYYIWTPYDEELEKLSDFLKNTVCKDMDSGTNKIKHLSTILRAFNKLLTAVSTLHCAAVYHLDISPGNIGLCLLGNEPDGDNISLFDINTVYSVNGETTVTYCGTAGFRSPDMIRGEVNQQCDFFSIGACLFYSLVMEKGSNGNYVSCKFMPDGYETECGWINKQVFEARFSQTEELLQKSPILDVLDKETRTKIADIIKKCLTQSRVDGEYYEGASDIQSDLESIITAFHAAEVEEKTATNQNAVRLSTENREIRAASTVQDGAIGAIQYELYERPLYKYADSKNNELNILVIGAGLYASKFTDLAFQLMQIDGYSTHITIASENIEAAKENYLRRRPEFNLFFDTDGGRAEYFKNYDCDTANPDERSYGRLSFVGISELTENNYSKNQSIVSSLAGNNSYSYVFVAKHNDSINSEVARLCEEEFPNAQIRFVYFGDTRDGKISVEPEELNMAENTLPVRINETITNHPNYKKLLQMASAIHLIWEQSVAGMRDGEAPFGSQYNKDSSFAAAVSIKYKLHSAGIEFDGSRNNTADVIKRYTALSNEVIESLTMFEHRRWVVEKVCDVIDSNNEKDNKNGWQVLKKDGFAQLKIRTHLKEERLHPCLLPGTTEPALDSEYWTAHTNWDTASDDKLDSLDPLDRMSIEMHRHFADRMTNEAREQLVNELTFLLGKIKGMASASPVLKKAFIDYNDAVLFLPDKEDKTGINTFKFCEKLFLQTLGSDCNLAEDDKRTVQQLTGEIKTAMFPLFESHNYTNYKKKDQDILLNVPFILSYNTRSHIVVPLITHDDRSELFGNIAAAIMINPLRLTFAVSADKIANDADEIIRSLDYSVKMAVSQNLQSSIDLLVIPVDSGDISAEQCRALLGKEDIPVTVSTAMDFAQKNPDALWEINGTQLSDTIRKECTSLTSFDFDAKTQKFTLGKTGTAKTDFLPNIPFHPSISVEESFESRDDIIVELEEPSVFKDYPHIRELLAELGSEERRKKLTALIADRVKDSTYKLSPEEDKSGSVSLSCSSENREMFGRLMNALLNAGIAEKLDESAPIIKNDRRRSQIRCKTGAETKKSLTRLTKNLHGAEDISFREVDGNIFVFVDSLLCSGLKLNDSEDNDFIELLDSFADEGYIIYTDSAEDLLSFEFASPEIKRILTVPDYLPCLGAYYTAVELGTYNDIRIVKIKTDTSGAESAYCVAATDRFSLLTVDCNTDAFNNLSVKEFTSTLAITPHSISLCTAD